MRNTVRELWTQRGWTQAELALEAARSYPDRFAVMGRIALEKPESRALVADLTGDGFVDGGDLGSPLAGWGSPGLGDLNGDGTTDGADLGLLLGNWGACGG